MKVLLTCMQPAACTLTAAELPASSLVCAAN